jgi:hypothetical protein
VEKCVREPRAGGDDVAALFDAVVNHAGTDELADDATVVIARW